jgi:BirA family biotin operon repressor/biotin-[acetyl-CoA-carboxylase] ligase
LPAHFTHLQSTGSTNDWLLARTAEVADGHWVIADRQTAGRGRRGRVWSDGAGNLMTSVLVRAERPVQQLSFVAALALRAALDLGDRVVLKWPNDLLLDGVKVSGILLEGAGDVLVIGMGVNLAQHPELCERPATSLAAAGLPVPLPLDVLARLMPAFADYRALWAAQGFGPIRTQWLAHAGGVGERITVRFGLETIEGRFEGLEADGALALRLDDGCLRAVHAGEVFALGGDNAARD